MFGFALYLSLIVGSLPGQLDRDAPTPPVQGLAKHKTPAFCDATADHGTSASCKDQAAAAGVIICPPGYHAVNLNCSPGQACTGGGQPGNWCTCTYGCSRDFLVIEEGEPLDLN